MVENNAKKIMEQQQRQNEAVEAQQKAKVQIRKNAINVASAISRPPTSKQVKRDQSPVTEKPRPLPQTTAQPRPISPARVAAEPFVKPPGARKESPYKNTAEFTREPLGEVKVVEKNAINEWAPAPTTFEIKRTIPEVYDPRSEFQIKKLNAAYGHDITGIEESFGNLRQKLSNLKG